MFDCAEDIGKLGNEKIECNIHVYWSQSEVLESATSAYSLTVSHTINHLYNATVTLWRFSLRFSAFGMNVVKRVSCGLMRKRNLMSHQWTLTIWSVPDCFELFKTNVANAVWSFRAANPTQPWLERQYRRVACTEHNLGGCGSIVNSGTGTGPTGFIQVSCVTGTVYIRDHPCPSWVYQSYGSVKNGLSTVSKMETKNSWK